MMATISKGFCPVCETTVPSAAPEGLCPRCLALAAVDLASDSPFATIDRPEPIAAGRFFGDYELLDEIARGGMGIVFRALQLGVNRIVALKVLAGGAAAGREFVHRFHNEAAAAARLEHPNIVPIYEFGEHEGTHFLAMRFLDGGTLQTSASRGLPTPAEAAGMVRKIAEAVEHAHRRGVLHRDLKPGNVLLDGEGTPQVTDFGLARLLDSDDSLTLSRAVIGTAAYLAPEVASAGAAATTTASDIYGLGAILYELLTGRPPFVGVTLAETLRAVHGEEPVRPSKLQPAVPGDLEIIGLKCLEKEPAKRYASAQALADDLGRFLKHEPIQARSVTPVERVWRWSRRKPALASSFVLLLLLILVVGIGAPITVFRINRARVESEHARAETERNLYAADMKLASQAVRDGAVDHARDLLIRHRPKPGDADLRGFEWRYLWRASDQHEVTQTLTGLASPGVYDPVRLVRVGDTLYNLDYNGSRLRAWSMIDWTPLPSPSGNDRWIWRPYQQTALAVDNTDHTLTLYQLPGLQKSHVIPLRGVATLSALSPDRRLLAVCFQDGDRERVSVWDLPKNAELAVVGDYSARVSQLEFSNDGKVLAVPSADGAIGLWDLATLKPLPAPSIDEALPHFIQFAPHSSRFVYWNWITNPLYLWDPVAGKSSVVEQGFRGGFEFSPDGERLAVAWGDVVWFFEGRSNRRVGALRGHKASVRALTFSPNGKLIATASRDGTASLWDLNTERQLATLGGHVAEVYDVAFSPDGDQLVTISVDGAAKVWNVPAVLGRDLLLSNSTLNWWLRMSADERLLASADNDGRIHIWDRINRTSLHSLQSGSPGQQFGLAFAPQGHLLAWQTGTTLGIFDLRSGQTNTIRIEGNHGFLNGISFSPDNREIMFSTPTNVMLCELATVQIRPFARCEKEVFSIGYSPDGTLLAFGHQGGAVSLWERSSGRKLFPPAGTSPAHAGGTTTVEFSPDGKWLASCGSLTIKLWHVQHRQLTLSKTFRGHAGYVPSIAFSPDGARLVSASSDSTLKLWDTAAGIELGTLYGHRGGAYGVVFSKDGERIYSTGEDGDVRVWEAPPLTKLDHPTQSTPIGTRPTRLNEAQ